MSGIINKITKYGMLCLLGGIFLFPFFWLISCSLRTPDQLMTSPPRMIPQQPTLQAFVSVLTTTDIPRYFMNTVVVAGTATLLCILIAVPAGYSFARHRYRGKNLVMLLILLCNMVPQASTLVPMYRTINSFGLVDNKFVLSVTHLLCMLPFSVIMIRGFISTLPKTLEEAAMIDGCSKIGILFRIILPVSAPGIFATAMYAFMISWEEFIYSMTFTTSKYARTISVGLQMFSSEFKTDWASILASAVMMTIPVLLLFLSIQDVFIASAVGGAIKE